ncbi:MAG: hypothetical protein ACYSWP_13975 [Planctomycetota bacterium]|jgi:hypothetical protein
MNKKVVFIVYLITGTFIFWYVFDLPARVGPGLLIFFTVLFWMFVYLKQREMSKWFDKILESTGLDKGKLQQRRKEIKQDSVFLNKHKAILKSITTMNIMEVYFLSDSGTSCGTQNLSLIEDFKKYLSGRMVRMSLHTAIAAYGSKVRQFTLQIHTEKGKFSYLAVVHPEHPDDIILMSPKQTDSGGIQLRGLKRWLDENVL